MVLVRGDLAERGASLAHKSRRSRAEFRVWRWRLGQQTYDTLDGLFGQFYGFKNRGLCRHVFSRPH
jgi:hypothetical protein